MTIRRPFRRRPKIAPLRLRVMAVAIDLAVGCGVLGVIAGVALGLRAMGFSFGRLRSVWRVLRRFQPVKNLDPDLGPGETGPPKLKFHYLLAFNAIALAGAVRRRNKRSFGRRKMGIRRVELRTGGSISVQSAVVQWTTATLWQWLVDRAFTPVDTSIARRQEGVNDDVTRIRRTHRHDPQGQALEIMQLYEQRGFNPLSAWGWVLIRNLVRGIPIPITARHQSLPDLVAGIVVVQD